jgi:hypothetical protein
MPHSKHDEKKPEQKHQSEKKTSDFRERIKSAIEKYTEKNKAKSAPTRSNGSPEKDLEKEVLSFLENNSFHVNVVESKATFNQQQQRFISSSVKSGFADIVGNHYTGIAVFIELKAPGRRSTLRDNQREFLLSKIETGCFAVCIDSVELLEAQWNRFRELIDRKQYIFAQDFLKLALPYKKQYVDDEPLFPEE